MFVTNVRYLYISRNKPFMLCFSILFIDKNVFIPPIDIHHLVNQYIGFEKYLKRNGLSSYAWLFV